MTLIWLIIVFGAISIVASIVFAWIVYRMPATGDATEEQAVKLIEISKAIAEGAMAFLAREYQYMLVFMVVFGGIVWWAVDWESGFSFLVGAVISILAGFIGMKAATMGNVRTTAAAQKSLGGAFRIAFNTGAVMGFGLVGLAVLGLIGMYLLLEVIMDGASQAHIMEALAGFGLGGSSIALFARVGGGIYTKAADIGADLVGKLEENIPEDDPRNPAVIADNVGDNVGDIAGMGADLFGSIAESTCAALVIGAAAFATAAVTDTNAMLYPILITAIGIPIALVFSLFARANTPTMIENTLKYILMGSTVAMGVVLYFVTREMLPEKFRMGDAIYTSMGVFYCVATGLGAGMLIGVATEYYTSHRFSPVREVAKASETGAATNVIYGLSLGYMSSLLPVIFIAATVFVGYHFAGMYGIAVASLGMLGTIAVGLTIDAFGPVADNAGGIAQMAGLGPEVRERTDALDSAGNTTAAIGKGFAIGSAALTSLALFSAFLVRSGVDSLNVLEPSVITMLVVGAMLPFIFTAMTLKSVGKAAMDMIKEVRRQFDTIPGLRPSFQLTEQSITALGGAGAALKGLVGKTFPTEDGLLAAVAEAGVANPPSDEAVLKNANLGIVPGKPDYRTCVDISTKASLREMLLPGAQVIFTPIVVGYLFGPKPLAAMLIGSLVAGVVLAISSANAGGAWDNAKKYIEAGALGGKGSKTHAAAVVGDTVGDPFKDTSGPSLNILIKLQAIISLVFAPFFTHSLNLLG